MNHMNEKTKRIKNFLKDLNELKDKHNLIISTEIGSGCIFVEEKKDEGEYVVYESGDSAFIAKGLEFIFFDQTKYPHQEVLFEALTAHRLYF